MCFHTEHEASKYSGDALIKDASTEKEAHVLQLELCGKSLSSFI